MSNDKDFKVKNGVKPTVYHEKLGTVVSSVAGDSLAGANYDSVSFSITAQDNQPFGITFKPDGTKMYLVGNTGDRVYQYSLSTPWSLSTASYDSVSFSVSSQDGNPMRVAFNSTGTKMFLVGQVTDSLYQYSLSTAWNVGTASYDSVSFSVNAQEGIVYDVMFNPAGTKMYVMGDATDSAYQYSLSTAFNLATASYDSVSFSFASQSASVNGFTFNSDGTRLYVSSHAGGAGTVYQYSLSTAYNLATASYSDVSFSVSAQDTAAYSVKFKDDGSKMYVLGRNNDTVYQYSTTLNTRTLDLSTGSVFQLTPASNIQLNLSNPAASGTVSGATLLLDGAAASSYDLANAAYDSVSFSVASQETSPAFVQFKADGTKMYVGGSGSDTVYQYSLSTAWDASTASYDSVSFSVASQENNLRGLYIKQDGTKFYTIGIQADVVHQYSMSTAWDISSASYDSVSFSVSSQENEAQGISFKSDGTKMFIVGSLGDEVNEFSLSTAWDISSASFTINFSVSGQDTNPNDLYFKPDGTKFWVSGDTNDTVYQYSCSAAWDISTASYDSVSFSVATQDTGPQGLAFGNNGTKMYVVGSVTDIIYQYSTGTPATITYDTAIEWPSGTAPTSPAIGDTDVLVFTTRDGGTSYKAALAIDGAV